VEINDAFNLPTYITPFPSLLNHAIHQGKNLYSQRHTSYMAAPGHSPAQLTSYGTNCGGQTSGHLGLVRKCRLILVDPSCSIELITGIGAGLQAKLLKIRIRGNRQIAKDRRHVFRRQIVIADLLIHDAWLVA
jgi:hypothetical protein